MVPGRTVLKRRSNKPRRFLFIVIGVLLVGVAAWMLLQRFWFTHRSSQTKPGQTVTETTETPSEAPVLDDDYIVPNDQPRKISMLSIDAEGYIQKVGVDKDNAIAAPNNVNLAGWYTYSAKPGDVGVSIIDGHVQGRYKEGVFKRLGQLGIGDLISVEYGDGSDREFEVVELQTMPAETASIEQYRQIEGIDKQLTLITCAGTYDKKAGSYNQRTLVRAKLK